MKRTIALASGLLLAVSLMSAPALAHEDHSGPPEHGHIMLLHADFEPNTTGTGGPWILHGYERCVELANGKALRNVAHHDSIHTGRAGKATRSAGHLVVPLTPLTPFTDCASFAKAIPPS